MTENSSELVEDYPGESSKDLTEPIGSIAYYKLLVKDLQACKECDGGKSWSLDIGNNRTLSVKLVWMQGDIVDVQDDFIKLKDSSGLCRVMTSNAIPGFNSWLLPGMYCSVLGQLQGTGSEPTIDGLRLNNASDNSVLREMWPLEVDELKEVLNNRIFPSLDVTDKSTVDEAAA